MHILEKVLLKPYTTFQIGGPAAFFVYAQEDEEVIAAAQHAEEKNLPLFIFGGGSNVLVNDKGFNGLAVRVETIGIDIAEETNKHVVLKLASGEVWDDVVRFAVEQEWYGIENLSHIPGFCGALAVQNVGAYGQEASQVVTKITAYHIPTKEIVELSNEECNFSYRKSIFNTIHKGEYIILHTFIKLQKNGQVNLSYGDVKKYFNDNNPSIAEVRQAIINIRNTKFPFPDTPSKGNAGSFFNAPSVTEDEFNKIAERVKQNFGEEAYAKLESIRDYLQIPQGYKIPGPYIIELCGLKGFQIGGVKVADTHAGVLINVSGLASAEDVLAVARHVIKVVEEKTSVKLNIEPQLIGFE